ncbi:DNA/RNA non-specific endonuclease [Glacieibacterium frigidum]|uniref:Type VII secretion system protein EssD-like domain-containing protein n=1 Tax=Glacieibacterium frigidum TaxID=2593303 RepID=A0A552UEX3_9SPHN|nr:DNA/RNA non-specific endonuclease [Glacieibacterium frigidum]TRW16770.1 hypothetical protein FMM06_00740 [Glacieibacterium frigidum]
MLEPVRLASTASRATQAATGVADTLIGASRVGGTGVVNTAALAEKVAAAGASNPSEAANLAREVNARLPLADQQRFQANLRSELAERNLPAASMGGDAASAAARRELALDVTQIALDVTGLFDPTPISDGANAVISLFRGDFLGAGLSAVSIVPYIGDAAKLGKLGKWAQTVEKAVDLAKTDSAFAKAVGPALDKLKDAIGGIPKSALDALPQSARDTILKMKDKLDDLGGAGVATRTDNVAALTTRTGRYGDNAVTWQVDAVGRPTRAEATLTEVVPAGTKRAAPETQAQDAVRALGNTGDDAGHIIGHRFMPDQGSVNMFPQELNFNRGAYKTMENEWAGWIDAGGTVKVKVDLTGGTANRPDKVAVSYEVFDDAGKLIYTKAQRFTNAADQSFNRVASDDIQRLMGR